jgi:hypothetical protein
MLSSSSAIPDGISYRTFQFFKATCQPCFKNKAKLVLMQQHFTYHWFIILQMKKLAPTEAM